MGVRSLCAAAAVLVAAVAAPPAAARGGNYVFDGGTRYERTQVRAALDASLFDWDLVPQQITIRIAPGLAPAAEAGTIDLDADLLDAGRFAWGVVQHEYAHQVDFFLLDDGMRAQLAAELGGRSWWPTPNELPHQALTCERFASTLAWAFWPSPDNVMRPDAPPAVFRALLDGLLGLQRRPSFE